MKLSPSILMMTLLALCFTHTQAYPTGAGNCVGGRSAAQNVGPHSKAYTTNSHLQAGKYVVKVDGTEMRATRPGTELTIPAGQEVTIELTTSETSIFRGFLIRLSGAGLSPMSTLDTLSFAEGRTDMQVSDLCTAEGVSGLTHTSNAEKTSVVGTILVPQAGPLNLDVTVVEINDDTFSRYYYSGFPLVAVDAAVESGPTNAQIQQQLNRLETKVDTLLAQCGGAPPATGVARTGDFP